MRPKPVRSRMGIVEEHTSPSFQPMMLERIIAVIMVVMSCRMAPKTTPLTPARSMVLLERVLVSAPALLVGLSK
jgi:hypothetical protein